MNVHLCNRLGFWLIEMGVLPLWLDVTVQG